MNKGFSLVELIVVIAIMAILVGVAVPTYTAYIDKAEKGVETQIVGDMIYAAKIANVEYKTTAKVELVAASNDVTITFTGENAEKAADEVVKVMADSGKVTAGEPKTEGGKTTCTVTFNGDYIDALDDSFDLSF